MADLEKERKHFEKTFRSSGLPVWRPDRSTGDKRWHPNRTTAVDEGQIRIKKAIKESQERIKRFQNKGMSVSTERVL